LLPALPRPTFFFAIVPTYQPSHFDRVYAAYGGWLMILLILWDGWSITWSRIALI